MEGGISQDNCVAFKDIDQEELFAPEEKFANPRDHLGRTAVDVKQLCDKTAECKCPVCSHKLIVRAGECVSIHFAHAPGRKDTSCKGGFESPWHIAAKRAAAMRPGWLHEYPNNEDRNSRFDAYNQFTRQAFEAVHSLSDTYVSKQRSLASVGIDSQWLFDSAAEFASRNTLPLDIDKARGGLLECYDVLSKRATSIIQEIGPDRCFLHYLGLAWKWVGVDRWQVCSPVSEIQKLCSGEHGLNRLLFDFRASGEFREGAIAFRNGDLVGTTWQEVSPQNLLYLVNERSDQLLEAWKRIKRNREYAKRRKGTRQYRPSTADDIASRSKPVCELIAEKSMTQDEVNAAQSICESAGNGALDTSTPQEDPLARIHRTWREHCIRKGWLAKEAMDGR